MQKAEQKLNMPATIVEKDFWACWILQAVFSLPAEMTFKGGTSLSKVFGLIDRFSEDCDITVDAKTFIEAIDIPNTSKSQLKKVSERLKRALQDHLEKTVISHLTKYLSDAIKDKKLLSQFKIKLWPDGEKISFYYPSHANLDGHYLRDHVLLEFGLRNSTEPSEKHKISPLIAEVDTPDLLMPEPKINTLSPVRTFWEKATLIHVECHRQRLTESPERLSRHWYDLARLASSWVGEEVFRRIDLLESVIEYKTAFFNASYAHYSDCLLGKLKLIPDDKELAYLKIDFNKMIDAGMFQNKPPAFDEIIKTLRTLEKRVNEKMKAR